MLGLLGSIVSRWFHFRSLDTNTATQTRALPRPKNDSPVDGLEKRVEKGWREPILLRCASAPSNSRILVGFERRGGLDTIYLLPKHQSAHVLDSALCAIYRSRVAGREEGWSADNLETERDIERPLHESWVRLLQEYIVELQTGREDFVTVRVLGRLV